MVFSVEDRILILNLVNYQILGKLQERVYRSQICDVDQLKSRLIEDGNISTTWSSMKRPGQATPFLQRVSIACYAERCISHDRFCLSDRLTVCLSHAGIMPKRL